MTKPTRPPVAQTGQAPALSPELRQKIATWKEISGWLEQGKKQEMELRKEIAATLVPTPKEGTNTVVGEGFELKLVHKVNRRLDKTTLDAIMAQMPEDARVIGTLIRYEPTFNLSYYRTLDPEVKKTFEQTLEITDGSPELEIVLSEAAKPETAEKVVEKRGYDIAGNPTVPPAKPEPKAKPTKPTRKPVPAKPAKKPTKRKK